MNRHPPSRRPEVLLIGPDEWEGAAVCKPNRARAARARIDWLNPRQFNSLTGEDRDVQYNLIVYQPMPEAWDDRSLWDRFWAYCARHTPPASSTEPALGVHVVCPPNTTTLPYPPSGPFDRLVVPQSGPLDRAQLEEVLELETADFRALAEHDREPDVGGAALADNRLWALYRLISTATRVLDQWKDPDSHQYDTIPNSYLQWLKGVIEHALASPALAASSSDPVRWATITLALACKQAKRADLYDPVSLASPLLRVDGELPASPRVAVEDGLLGAILLLLFRCRVPDSRDRRHRPQPLCTLKTGRRVTTFTLCKVTSPPEPPDLEQIIDTLGYLSREVDTGAGLVLTLPNA